MRFAELAFLVLLALYQAFLLVPRRQRSFPANYLVFLAGMALAWNLAVEGLRWQTLPPTLLLLVDLAVLFPSFSTLRGRPPRAGFLPALGRGVRTAVSSVGFLWAVGCVALAVAFPLPSVELTGGLRPSHRVVWFPQTADRPGLELQLWYPASGDSRPLPRPISEAETWQRKRVAGGAPAFWQSYWEYLPTSMIRGGKLASPGTKYPVVYVAVPRGQEPGDFGYMFEDLASRGLVVVAAEPLPEGLSKPEPFQWKTALADVFQPLRQPTLWVEPDLSLGKAEGPADYRWVAPAVEAVRELDAEPGDILFSGVDWKRQGLWVWGYGTPMTGDAERALGIKAVVHAGGRPPAGHVATIPEFWISAAGAPLMSQPNQWVLTLPALVRADLSDAAYLKPALAFVGGKSQADGGFHGAVRQYAAAFYQFALWGSSGDTTYRQTVPEIPGLTLVGK